MNDVVLRPYQTQAVTALREGIRAGHRKQVLMSPTGSGKTEIACYMLQEAHRKYSRAIFVVDRVVLVDQTSERLDRYGIPHGVIQAGHWRTRLYERIQVCSAQTIEQRGIPDDVAVVFVDEAHCLRKKIVEYLAGTEAIVIGLTATPFTKGMGAVYSNLINVTTMNQLIADEFLVPLKMYAAKAINVEGMKIVAGEWSEKEIEERGLDIIGDIVAEWANKTEHHFGGPVKTIVFSATVDHGAELCRQFQAAGFNFQQISYKDGGDDHRRALIEEFRKPDSAIHGLVSCEVFTKGFDVPDVLCGISARPYRKSLSSHIQQMGRVMRASPGKTFGLWLCVAKGSRVLTDRGLVPIEQVRLSDKIWDGTNFVSHGGAICNGIQKTIRYQGLEATPGHLVHTSQGWRTFGDCARQQVAITQTGIGGTPVRTREGDFAACSMARSQASPIHSRRLRVRDLWLSCGDIARELGRRANGWMQALRTACAGIPAMALCASAGDARALSQSEGRQISNLRRDGRGVPFRGREGGDALDHAKPRVASAGRGDTVGSYRPEWPLRAGQHSLAERSAQPTQQARESGDGETAQIQNGASGDSILGQHAQRIFQQRNDVRAGDREIPQAFDEAEREVWDILDCGPRNRFTCEGLLVHNCHSGNSLRFMQDTAEIFESGCSELDDGKREAKARKEPTERERAEIRCSCGYIMAAWQTVCPGCQKERKRISTIEALPGQMVELDGNAANKKYAWPAKIEFIAGLRGYAQSRGYSPGWVAHQYRNKFGVWPNDPRLKVEAGPITAEVNNWVRSQQIRWAKSRHARAA